MATTFDNPYQPASAIGAGLHNIAIGLFGGKKASEDKTALNAAHAAYYDAETRPKDAEGELNESYLAARSDDAVDSLIAARSGVDVPTVRGYRRARASGLYLDQYKDIGPKVDDAELAFKTGFADKTISSVDIAKALNEYQTMRNRSAVIAGTADPTRTAQGYFSVSGHAPYHAGETATTNLLTGTTQTTPLGEAKIGTEKA